MTKWPYLPIGSQVVVGKTDESTEVPDPNHPSRTDRNWRNAIIAIIALAVFCIGLVGWNVTLYQSNHRQDAQLAAAAERDKAADDLRVSEARAAKARTESECRGAIAGTALGNSIISKIREAWVAQAKEAQNPDFKDVLEKNARDLPVFPTPNCNPGPGGDKGP